MFLYQKPEEPIELFFLYVSEDKKICDDLQKHLWQSMRGGHIRWWYDDLILPGQVKDFEIKTHMNRADICIVLVSPDFVASDYCDGTTMKLAMDRHNAGDICVIPVIVRAVEWSDTPFGSLQQLPKGTRAIMSRRNYDEALKEVADGIREVLNARTSVSSTRQEASNKSPITTSQTPQRPLHSQNLVIEIPVSLQSMLRFREERGQSYRNMQSFTKTIEIFRRIGIHLEDDEQK